MKVTKINISEFKVHCLRLLKEIQKSRNSILITLRGAPLATVYPHESAPPASRCLGGSRDIMTVHGDIISHSFADDWEVLKN